MHRVSDSAASRHDSPLASRRMWPSPQSDKVGTRYELISELNGWPACTPSPCNTRGITVASVGFGAERLAKPFSYDSFIRYSRPVYPGAFLIDANSIRYISIVYGIAIESQGIIGHLEGFLGGGGHGEVRWIARGS